MAAPTIISRSYAAVQDNRAVLNNSTIVRPCDVGDWNAIRICARVSITDQGAALMFNPQLAIGLCSGSSNIYTDASTTYFMGAISSTDLGFNIAKQTGPPYYVTMSFLPAIKQNTSFVRIPSLGGPTAWARVDIRVAQYQDGGGANPCRSLFFVDIIRPSGAVTPTSGSYIIKIFGRYTTVAAYDASFSDFTTEAILATLPGTWNEHQWFDLPIDYAPGYRPLTTNVEIAGDELTYGALDHVCVGWTGTAADIEVSDIGFVRLA